MAVALLLPKRKDWYQSIPPELRWDCRVILHFINDRQGYYATGWVPLNRKILRNYVHSKHLTEAFEHLIRVGIIERGRSYLPGYKSKQHRIKPAHAEMEVVWCHDKATVRRFKRRKGNVRLQKHHEEMKQMLKHIRLDLAAAFKIIDKEVDVFRAERYRRTALKTAAILEAESAELFVDDFGHRVHTVLTRLPKKLRAALRYDGESMCGIDITCSQPLFLAGSVYESAMQEVEKNGSSIKMCRFLKQATEFKELCSAGKLYESLMKVMKDGASRDDVKKLLFKEVCFGRGTGFGAVGRAFRRTWDAIVAWLIEQKRGDHKKIARSLQRLESSVMIGDVGRRLIAGGIPFFTVHDEFRTLRRHVERVKEVIQEEMSRINLSPLMDVVG
jgi:hypothetical protein